MLQSVCRAGVEGMTNLSGPSKQDMYKDAVASILSLLIAITIIAFVGKFLWNTTVAELFTFARPVQSVWQIIGLMIILSMMRYGGTQCPLTPVHRRVRESTVGAGDACVSNGEGYGETKCPHGGVGKQSVPT